jgi:hypothetical protein
MTGAAYAVSLAACTVGIRLKTDKTKATYRINK